MYPHILYDGYCSSPCTYIFYTFGYFSNPVRTYSIRLGILVILYPHIRYCIRLIIVVVHVPTYSIRLGIVVVHVPTYFIRLGLVVHVPTYCSSSPCTHIFYTFGYCLGTYILYCIVVVHVPTYSIRLGIVVVHVPTYSTRSGNVVCTHILYTFGH